MFNDRTHQFIQFKWFFGTTQDGAAQVMDISHFLWVELLPFIFIKAFETVFYSENVLHIIIIV